jgi:hypothetical protein
MQSLVISIRKLCQITKPTAASTMFVYILQVVYRNENNKKHVLTAAATRGIEQIVGWTTAASGTDAWAYVRWTQLSFSIAS